LDEVEVEDLDVGYRKDWVNVTNDYSQSIETFIYIALQINNQVKP
jgi:hypothetical protein